MIKITSKDFDVTDSIRSRIESKFSKLSRHDVRLINSHVIITQEKQKFKIEASVVVPNGKLFAKATQTDLYAAINAMGNKLEKQLTRLLTKPLSQRYTASKINDVDANESLDELLEEELAA